MLSILAATVIVATVALPCPPDLAREHAMAFTYLPTSDLANPADTLHRRMLRRGIPYGAPLPIGATSDPENADRGLLFLAFMTSIRDQFELPASDWMNDDKNPGPAAVGVDMLVGQGKGPGRARGATIPHDGATFSVSNAGASAPDWVYPTGGGYFFAPSLSAIRMLGDPQSL
jgi:hypothetical protein